MTQQEYCAVLTRLGLTQSGAGRLVGVDPVTSRRWAAGIRPVPEPVARFLTYILRTGARPEQVLERLAATRK